MIKVLHLITDLDTGGAEIMLYRLLSSIDKNKFDNVVVCMIDKGRLIEKIKSLGIHLYTLQMKRGVPDILGLLHLCSILREERPQILQTWLYHADLLGLLGGRISGAPVIIWNLRCSNMDLRYYSKLTTLVIKILTILSPFPDAVIVNSNVGKVLHRNVGYHPRRLEMIPNGFDLDYFRPDSEARARIRKELGIDDNIILIGSVARFDPMKDHDNFLKAANILLKNYHNTQNVYFLLVGHNVDYTNKKLNTMIKKLDLEKYVYLLGQRKDISRIIAALDIATSSSSYGEGFPNVIGEAMSCGIPCVVTDVGDSALIVGDTGKVVPPKDSVALARAWSELITIGREKRKQLGSSARKRIEENYNLSMIVKKYEQLYEELVKNKLKLN